MLKKKHVKNACCICCKNKTPGDLISGGAIREVVTQFIKKDYPEWSTSCYICRKDLDHYRAKYVESCLAQEKGELSHLETEVINSMHEQEMLSKNINSEFDNNSTIGQRIADKVADFGGSWNFIISFAIILIGWVAINSLVFIWKSGKPFDPFPFILLNLLLSGIAGFQAPIIMMSQNRQEAKDRMRAEHDYQVNLKAELEIRNLHEKMDHLLHTQSERLMEIQQIQTDLMEELANQRNLSEKTSNEISSEQPKLN